MQQDGFLDEFSLRDIKLLSSALQESLNLKFKWCVVIGMNTTSLFCSVKTLPCRTRHATSFCHARFFANPQALTLHSLPCPCAVGCITCERSRQEGGNCWWGPARRAESGGCKGCTGRGTRRTFELARAHGALAVLWRGWRASSVSARQLPQHRPTRVRTAMSVPAPLRERPGWPSHAPPPPLVPCLQPRAALLT